MPTVALGRFVVTGTDLQIADVRAALAACAYPAAEKLPRDIPVKFADLTSYRALGLFWTDGRIEIHHTLTGERAQSVFLAEAWHAVDQYILTNADRAAVITAAHEQGPDGHTWFDNESYYAHLGEMTMDAFLRAFTAYPPTGIRWEHAVTDRVTTALRGILTPEPELPAASGPFPTARVRAWLDKDYSWTRAERAAKTAIREWLPQGAVTGDAREGSSAP